MNLQIGIPDRRLVLFLFLSLAGCGGPSGQEKCKSVQRMICDKVFDCAEAEPWRAKYGATKAACISMLDESTCNDSSTGCSPGQTYHPDVADTCASAVSALSCAQLGAEGEGSLYPSVCNPVCTGPE